MSTTNIAILLQAAEYLERKDRGKRAILAEICSCFDLSDATLECVGDRNGRSIHNTGVIVSLSEAEHGYASTLPMPDDYSRRKTAKSRKFHGNRYVLNDILCTVNRVRGRAFLAMCPFYEVDQLIWHLPVVVT